MALSSFRFIPNLCTPRFLQKASSSFRQGLSPDPGSPPGPVGARPRALSGPMRAAGARSCFAIGTRPPSHCRLGCSRDPWGTHQTAEPPRSLRSHGGCDSSQGCVWSRESPPVTHECGPLKLDPEESLSRVRGCRAWQPHTAAAEDHRSAAERCRPSCPRLGPALAASAACTGWTMAGATAPQGAKGGEEVGVRACLEDLGNCFHFRGKGGQLPDHWSLLTFTGMVMNQFR